MARPRFQEDGWLRVEGRRWRLTYRDSSGKRTTVSLGPAYRDYDKDAKGKFRPIGPVLNRAGLKASQARAVARELYLSKVDRTTGPVLTVGEFWRTKYLPWAETAGTPRASTLAVYQSIWTSWLEPVIGGTSLRSVTLEHAETVISDVRRAGLSDSTVKLAKAVGSAVFSRALNLEFFEKRNPFHRLRLGEHRPVRERFPLTAEQARQLLATVDDQRRPMVMTALLTGMNAAELAGLKGSDIDLAGGRIEVRRQWIDGTGYGPLKTKNRHRDIPLAARGREVLEPLVTDPDSPVFPGQTPGIPCCMESARKRHLRPAGEALGLPGNLGWHIFRHTFATWLQSAIVRDFDIEALMGHAQRTITRRVYTHEDFDRLRQAIESIAGNLAQPAARGKIIEFRRPA